MENFALCVSQPGDLFYVSSHYSNGSQAASGWWIYFISHWQQMLIILEKAKHQPIWTSVGYFLSSVYALPQLLVNVSHEM